ncbi:MAG: FAD-dependent thymidylate synthase [bacterium]
MQVDLISITPDAERVIESAGRTAYLSFDKETNFPIIRGENKGRLCIFRSEEYPDIASVREGMPFSVESETWIAEKVWANSAEKFVEMLVRSGHLSVLEHASATFRIRGASRAFTHQLVRHRMASFTQQSQRYVGEENFRIVEPPSIMKNPEAHDVFVNSMERARLAYHRLQELGIQNEDARFVLPNSIESEIVATADLREWRHIVEIRGGRKAQWEIRSIILDILRIFKEKVPAAFFDLEIDGEKGVVLKINDDG